MKPNVHTFELIYRLAIIFTIIALLGCGSGSNSADNESTDRSATITFQIKFNNHSNHALNISVNHAIGEPNICNDYLIDKIGVQVYHTQDDSEVASAEVDCAEHSLTVSNVPAGETLHLVCKGYVGSNPVWQGRVDGIVAVAGQNTDIGVIDMNYSGDDGAAPEVVSTFPATDATNVDLNSSIVVVFNEKLAPSTIPDQAITVFSNDIPVSGQVGYDPAFNSIRFLPANAFDPEKTYTATLQSQSDDGDTITDTAGHPFSGDVSWVFATRGTDDNTAPQVIATSPPNGATDVAPQTLISAVFSEPMDPDSLTDTVFQISSDQGTVSGQITYDDQSRTLSLTPDSALNAATLYIAVISTEARDLAQNFISETYTWQFWTSGPLYNLTVAKSGNGSGSIVSTTSSHIDCGDTCQTGLSAGTTVTLEAVSDNSSEFTGWSGDFCNGDTGLCSFTMTSNTTITANFALRASFTINASVIPENGSGGSISPPNATVIYGDDQNFDIQVNPYYILSELIVDGVTVTPTSSYLFENVIEDHTIQAIINHYLPKISANGNVVWRGRNNEIGSYYDIYYYDKDKETNPSTNISVTHEDNDSDHNIDAGGHAVWASDGAIYYYDKNNETSPVTIISKENGRYYSPEINANGHVVFAGSDGSDTDIYYYDGSTPKNITEGLPGSHNCPQINANGLVVWESYIDSKRDIYLSFP